LGKICVTGTTLGYLWVDSGIYCRSDQLDRPDHPYSPTKLDRSSFTTPLVLDRVRSCRLTIGHWSSRGRLGQVLIGKTKLLSQFATTLDPYTIISRSLLERMATRSLLDFFDSQK